MSAPDLEPDLLKAFLAVAEHRSFTRAATALNRTQSAVSVQIRRLEERIGTKLFHRNRAGIAPTAAGNELRVYARRILALNAEAVGAIHARRTEAVVRLGVMDDYGTIVIPPLLASFAKHHPPVQVEIETGLTSTMPARLGEAYDLVIAMHPQGRGDGELLKSEQPVWAASASYRAGARDRRQRRQAITPRQVAKASGQDAGLHHRDRKTCSRDLGGRRQRPADIGEAPGPAGGIERFRGPLAEQAARRV
ncbi:LysR family transcriptional regulator [Bradyrhizobium sp. AS23.2]|uniref:LysR family transcriptional regulator n=1 Tax=Bradyrhizobium sp. AS23.2 TaxID=1680155 RepID=UPI000AB7A0B5|nr:LysR family transcriptional regulator [Bradyrhizobium sp. AS23.2]